MQLSKQLSLRFTADEWDYLYSDMRGILRTHNGKASGDRFQFDPSLVYLTENPNAMEAIEKLTNGFQKQSDETIVNIELTFAECSGLKDVMYNLLMEFNTTPHKNRMLTNPVTASAYGKVYNAVSENEHPHLLKEHFNSMVQFHIDAIKRRDPNWSTAKFEALFKT